MLLGAGASAARYLEDLRLRRAVLEFAREARLERQNPEVREDLGREPSGDLAADAVISAAVEDEDIPLSEKQRPRAQDLLLDAVAVRPGWAEHRYLLALVSADKPNPRIRRTLRLAADGAPGFPAVWPALSRANVDAWPDLTPAERARTDEAFRHALHDVRFVESDFSRIVSVAGVSRATGLLPEQASVLEAAAAPVSALGETTAASELLTRAERAERRERQDGLAALERRRQLGDGDALRTGCWTWFARHPYGQLDDAAGRAQLVRLLKLWPDDRRNAWSRNARLRLVEFFLDGKRPEASPEILDRTLDSLSSPPALMRARVALKSGNVEKAEELARLATSGDPDWASYFRDLARAQAARGRFDDAELTLARLPIAGRGRCDAALLAREISRVRRDDARLDELERRLDELRAVAGRDLGSGGSLAICRDPEQSERRLELRVGPGLPSILAYGWGPSRAATVVLSGDATVLSVSTAGFEGEDTLWANFLAGGQGRSIYVSLQESP